MQTWLGLLHGSDYFLVHLLLGTLVFQTFILPAGGEEAVGIDVKWKKQITALAGLTLLTSLLWTLFTCADMSESWIPGDLWVAIRSTTFGQLWCLRIFLLSLFFGASFFSWSDQMKNKLFLTIGLGVILLSSLSGHAASQENGKLLRITVDWLHSLAVGIWSGGLVCLFRWLGERLLQTHLKAGLSQWVVERFSKFAIFSTLIIGVTGFVLAYDSGLTLDHPIKTLYGKFVIAKLSLFFVTLVAASINQFVHLRGYRIETEFIFSKQLKRETRLEIVIILFIFGIAGFLTRTPLPILH